MTRALTLLLFAGVLCAGNASLHAQSNTVLLAHGLSSNGPAWLYGANKLKARMPDMFFVAPTFGSFRSFYEQAEILRAAMSTSDHIVIGHSNGGTVLRTAALMGQQMYAGVTLGSPQRGAPLADRVIDGSLLSSLGNWWSEVVFPLQFYVLLDYSWYTWMAIGLANHIHPYVGAWVSTLITHFAVSTASNTVVADMGAFGHANRTLNTPQNLALEAQRIPRRFSITYEYEGPGVIWKGLRPDLHEYLTLLQWGMYNTYIGNYDYFANYYDDGSDWDAPAKRAFAWTWVVGATALQYTDLMWCGMIGANVNGRCLSDGIVPVSSQHWPGSTIGAQVYGLGHMEQTSDARSLEAIEIVLRWYLGV